MPVSNPPSWSASEKNKLEGSAWILLFELEYNPGSFIRLARWTQNVVWDGKTWTAWPIGEPQVSQNLQGELPTTTIPIVGMTSFIMSLVENVVIEGKKGIMYLVHEDHLADNTPVRITPFTVVQLSANWQAVQFVIVAAQAAFEPLKVQLPLKLVTREEFPGVQGSKITV